MTEVGVAVLLWNRATLVGQADASSNIAGIGQLVEHERRDIAREIRTVQSQ